MSDSPPKPSDVQGSDSRPRTGATTLDELFDVLAHQRRRHILRCLHERRTPMVLTDLAEEVAAREEGRPVSEVPAETVERVTVSLHHSHVPKLANANVVEYAEGRELVTLSTASERVEPFLELGR